MFVEPGNTTVTIAPSAQLLCELNLLVVGGGGSGDYYADDGGYSDDFGGGGSGYVSSTTVPVPTSLLVVTVGGAGEESSLHTEAGELLFSAQPGKNCHNKVNTLRGSPQSLSYFKCVKQIKICNVVDRCLARYRPIDRPLSDCSNQLNAIPYNSKKHCTNSAVHCPIGTSKHRNRDPTFYEIGTQ